MTRVLLGYDVGSRAGLGHRSRMRALATALGALGVDARAVAIGDGERLAADVVVVDSYRHRADDASLVSARRVVAVDDLARDLAVDLLVSPTTPVAPAGVRAGRVLTGHEYALLDPGLRSQAGPPPAEVVRSLLVTLGASAAAASGPALAETIGDRLDGVEVRLVVGPWFAGDVPSGVIAVRAPDGLGPWLRDADVVVTAAGVTMLEALCLARPVVAVVLADNQRPAAQEAVRAGAAVVVSPADVAQAVVDLAADVERRCELAVAAGAFVDGRGAERVAEAVRALL